MVEPENMVLILLREMRAEMKQGFNGVDQRFDAVDARFDRMEKKIEAVKQAGFGESVLGRLMTAEVDERLENIEENQR